MRPGTRTDLACPSCEHPLVSVESWHGANHCRAAFVLAYVREHPDLSTWEIAQGTGLSYDAVSRGLTLARERKLIQWTAEDRDGQEGHRYRYHVLPFEPPYQCKRGLAWGQ